MQQTHMQESTSRRKDDLSTSGAWTCNKPTCKNPQVDGKMTSRQVVHGWARMEMHVIGDFQRQLVSHAISRCHGGAGIGLLEQRSKRRRTREAEEEPRQPALPASAVLLWCCGAVVLWCSMLLYVLLAAERLAGAQFSTSSSNTPGWSDIYQGREPE